MPEYLEDPSVLTKEKLKSQLLANNVILPNGDQRKDVYVQLYLNKLTVQNKKVPSSDTFSSDEELQPPSVTYIKSHSGRKATRKTDKPRPEDLDVTELTNEGLKDELLKYGVSAGPIVASTRKLYEKKLQKFLDQGPPGAVAPPAAVTQVDSNHNGNSDSDRYSDKEDEVTTVLEPEPIPVVERPIRSRGKTPTPVTTRTRSSQHHRINNPIDDDDLEEDWPLLNVKRRSRTSTSRVDQLVPASDDTDVSELSGPELVLPSSRAAKTKAPLPLGVRKDSRPISVPSLLLQNQSTNAVPEHLVLTARVHSTSSSMTPLPMCCEDDGLSPSYELASLLNNALIEVEKIAAGEQTPNRLDEKDVLKEMFPYETDTPTGINATCRRPIRGAAGRPVKSSDLWTDETLLRSIPNSYTESRTSTVHRVTALPPSSRLLTSASSPAGKAVATRRGLSVWLQILLLSVVAAFIFFVYQTMEANPMNPFGGPGSTKVDSDASK